MLIMNDSVSSLRFGIIEIDCLQQRKWSDVVLTYSTRIFIPDQNDVLFLNKLTVVI